MKQLIYLVETMRPKQWTKNVIIFAALVFDNKLLQPNALSAYTSGILYFSV